MNVLSSTLGFFLVIFSHFVCYSNSKIDPNVIDQAKRSVVSVDRRVALSAYTLPYNFAGNGVVIDKQAGYILTSGVVVGPVMVAAYTIGFFNGTETKAKVMYCDPWLDYAILKVDPSVIPKETKAIKLSNKHPIIGQSVFTIAKISKKKPTLYFGKIADTNFNVTWTMPQHFICVSTATKSSALGSLVFNKFGEAVALNCALSDTINIGLHLGYIQYALSALKQQKMPVRRHIGALLTNYSLDDAVRYDRLSEVSQKAYVKQFPNAQNRMLQVESVLQGTPASDKLFPGDLIWAINGQLIGPNLIDFDMAINRSIQDHIVLTIFRNGCYQDTTLPLYNLEDHRITRMVQFGGAIFFETDDFASKLGGVTAKTLACCMAESNTIFKASPTHINNVSILGIKMLAINGQPTQTLDALITLIPKLIQQKYFTIEYINFIPMRHGEWVLYAHDQYKGNVAYDVNLAPPRVWMWDPIQLEWKCEAIV